MKITATHRATARERFQDARAHLTDCVNPHATPDTRRWRYANAVKALDEVESALHALDIEHPSAPPVRALVCEIGKADPNCATTALALHAQCLMLDMLPLHA